MIDWGRRNLLGIHISAVDYEAALAKVIAAARARQPLALSALAVHGVMTGVLDPAQAARLNALDLVVPDGQPVRWALRLLHGVRLPDRVYGPTLTLKVCEAAARQNLPVYLYGSRPPVLNALAANLCRRFPALVIAGQKPSAFRRLSAAENDQVMAEIRASGAALVLVGLGCPRQEVWVYENRAHLDMPLLAVGAAFDFHAGLLPQAPAWLQHLGLEWLFRLLKEPARLWKRYLYLNPLFLFHLFLQWTGWRTYQVQNDNQPAVKVYFG
jgi:N-acetylglucosaminyldiphosphoundecaprenol N-acetyl-beta-D-mannosaminyltransferase